MGRAGLEPATNGLPTHRSGQVRLFPVFCCATKWLVVQRSGQNRAIPVPSESLASNKRRLIDLWPSLSDTRPLRLELGIDHQSRIRQCSPTGGSVISLPRARAKTLQRHADRIPLGSIAPSRGPGPRVCADSTGYGGIEYGGLPVPRHILNRPALQQGWCSVSAKLAVRNASQCGWRLS